jgi:hypothetical protein
MLLFTHTACGVLIASLTNNPVPGGMAALVSHYILDIIPHEPKEELFYASPDKSKRSKEVEEKLRKRQFTSLIDMLLSLVIFILSMIYIFPKEKYFFLVFILGFSVLPDLLTILAIYLPNKYLTWHHKYHFEIHKIIPVFVNHLTTYTIQILLAAGMVLLAARVV